LAGALCAAFFHAQARAQLERPDQSSEQTMKYEVEDDQIVEKPVPSSLEEREGFTYDVEDTSQDQTDKPPSLYNKEGDDVVMGSAYEQPEQPVGEGTISESITPDRAVTEGPAEDAPVADETVIESGLQSSPSGDDTMRSQDGREDAGLDTTQRENATDDLGVQENASPYASTPDLFSPQKSRR